MQVKVLQHHIDEGQRKSGTRCAIALALREAFPEALYVHVGADILIEGFASTQRVPAPANARTFIRAFDRSQPVEPFTFELPPLWIVPPWNSP